MGSIPVRVTKHLPCKKAGVFLYPEPGKERNPATRTGIEQPAPDSPGSDITPQQHIQKPAAFSGVRTRKHCRKIYQKQAVGCVAVAWRPQRTPAFRRLAIGLFLRFSRCFAVLPLARQNQSFLALTLLFALQAETAAIRRRRRTGGCRPSQHPAHAAARSSGRRGRRR